MPSALLRDSESGGGGAPPASGAMPTPAELIARIESVPFTRVTEHKHFAFNACRQTVITREYPAAYERGAIPYYPIRDARQTALYDRYRAMAQSSGVMRSHASIAGGLHGKSKSVTHAAQTVCQGPADDGADSMV